MKRVRMLIVFIMVSLLGQLNAFAATETYIAEIGMTIKLPDDHVVFTRDVKFNDPQLAAYNLTKEELLSYMNDGYIYLDAWDTLFDHEIIITMLESSYEDFNTYSDDELSEMATAFLAEYKKIGFNATESEICQFQRIKFLKTFISYNDGTNTQYGLQYFTVYDNKAITISIQSYSQGERVTLLQENYLYNTVDSITFDAKPKIEKQENEKELESAYVDSLTKARFIVPEGWIEAPLNEEREYIDVKFIPIDEDGSIILYGSYDLWNDLSDVEREGYTRAEINNSAFLISDVAAMYELPIEKIEVVNYGESEYYIAANIINTTFSESGLSIPITVALHFDNGYMHMFQFGGFNDSDAYQDFELLLASFNLTSRNDSSSKWAGTDLFSTFSFENILLSLLVTAAIYSLPIYIYRFVIRKSAVDAKQAKRISIMYGIFAYILMSIIIFTVNGSGVAGGSILLWSYINYHMLRNGMQTKNTTIKTITTYSDSESEVLDPKQHCASKAALVEDSREFTPQDKNMSVPISNKEISDVNQSGSNIEYEIKEVSHLHGMDMKSRPNEGKLDEMEASWMKQMEVSQDATREAILEGNTIANNIELGQHDKNTEEDNLCHDNGSPKYCRICGFKLLEGSNFCSKCGNKTS